MSSSLIKQEALRLGFDACGICKAEFTGKDAKYLREWLNNGFQGEMHYMERNLEKRCNPQLLVENAQSIIVVALNYYPTQKQPFNAPQIAYYAYGKDYHLVMKSKLKQLFDYINREIFPIQGRCFCDTAPLLEKYHAQKAGIGWIGKHTQLIIPGKGSFFFLGALVIDQRLAYDSPISDQCGNCNRCLKACPTNALVSDRKLNANRCLSYLSIEYKGEFPEKLPNNQVYGCDVCNKVCPHNQTSNPTNEKSFYPSQEFLSLTKESILQMDEKTFNQLFNQSAIQRIGLERLKRNTSK